ncbi:MHO_1580 family protein [Metamycoplasma canadense]|nr:hypothetical protein [Metamycoplasma canadense]
MFYNYQLKENEKNSYEYKESLNANFKYLKDNKNKNLDLGLNKNDECEIKILRNLELNTWIIEFTIPIITYNVPKFKNLILNEKKLLIEDIEKIPSGKVRFKTIKFEDNTFINFEDLKTLRINFYNKARQYTNTYIAFEINFNLSKTDFDFNYVNVKNKNLKLNFIESINFKIQGNKNLSSKPFEDNVGYYNNLIYDFKFYNLKQNKFLYKALEQKIELKTPNRYYKPDRQYEFNFLDKVLIKNNDGINKFNLISKKTDKNNFKYKIEYFIDKNNFWDKDKKEFLDTSKKDLLGYHVPLKYAGNLEIQYEIKQKIIKNFNTINYKDQFLNKLFDVNEGLIKLRCDVVKTEDEYENLHYSNWIKKIL